MPYHQDAIKRVRQTAKRNERNRAQRSAMRTDIKKLREAIEAKDLKAAEAQLAATTSTIQKVAQKGVIHHRNASRRVGRLAAAVQALRTR